MTRGGDAGAVHGAPYRETIVYEVNRIASALALAEAATDRLRRVLRPGLADAVASMLKSDVESAGARLQWLRERAADGGDGPL